MFEVTIRITAADADAPFSAVEKRVLAALHSHASDTPAAPAAAAEAAAAEATAAPTQAAPAAEEAPKRTRRTKAQIAADKAAEEAAATAVAPASGLGIFEDLDEAPADPEQAEEAEAQAPAAAAAPAAAERSLKEALDLATKLLTEGGAEGRKQVMAALEGTSASKVSELAGGDITIFVNALEA